MSEILLYYKRPDPTTWVYMSSFLTIGLYFVFHRFWSVRNLDIFLVILLAPGLLVVYEGRRREIRQNELLALQESQRDDVEASGLADPWAGPATDETGSRLIGNPLESAGDSTVSRTDAAPTEGAESRETAAVESTNETNEVGASTGESESSANASGSDEEADEAGSETPATQIDGEQINGEQIDGEQIDGEPGNAASIDRGGIDDEGDGESTGEGEVLDEPASYQPADVQRWGFIYLFIVEAIVLLRLMLDPLMDRRPLLDPNLTTGGLNFIGISLFIFMMANVINSSPQIQQEQGPKLGPGYALMNMLPAIPTRPVSESIGGATARPETELDAKQTRLSRVAKSLAILAQMSVVSAIVLIGNRHFSNLRGGVGCATLYLMLPYTAQMTGRVDHVLPAALLLWAVLCHRRPMVAGIFIGLAGGLLYYPLFLLPLWFSFYWQRGARGFAVGVVSMLVVLMVGLWFDDTASLLEHLQRMFGILNPQRNADELDGIWALGWNPIWRLPVIVAFVILSVFFAIWPAQKNLGTLMSGTAAIMVAAQFWHGSFGGLYLAWFMPLLLLTIFRPNLQDRIATKVVINPRPSGRNSSELTPV